uniref:Uncharacterized protein n=1 Tax=Timema cristinae TaxID=61476 RepID=A0A7R9GTH8_TIMCR|nr:unnamed protein product [Timema cristinae]
MEGGWKTTLSASNRDSNPDIPIFGSLVQHEKLSEWRFLTTPPLLSWSRPASRPTLLYHEHDKKISKKGWTLKMIQTKQPSSKIQHGGSGNKPLWNRTSGWTPGPVATRRDNQGNITGGKKGRADTYSPRLVELEFLPETDMTTVNKLVRDFLQHIQERWRVQPVPPHPYKVTHRSQYGIKHETLPGEWHRNRRRAFLESETCGHFSPFWLPYREIGGVVFDLRKLVLDNLVPALLLQDNKSQVQHVSLPLLLDN